MRLLDRYRGLFIPALILAASAAGCEVGPDYHAPRADVPSDFAVTTRPTTNPTSVTDAQHSAQVDWWTKFNDDELNSLVARSLTANHELKIAAARVQEARAIERVAQSELYPTIDISAFFVKTRGSAAGYGFPYG